MLSAVARTASRADKSGQVVDSAGGGEFKWRLMTTAGFECGNSIDPVSKWYAVAARAYWSARPSISSPINCSGAE
ncbi:hypothetical protein AU191_08810 [Mycolicibacterium acapulense]|nr:hypothetical protein AU191_08810 [Mycolicibacterium acapulense]